MDLEIRFDWKAGVDVVAAAGVPCSRNATAEKKRASVETLVYLCALLQATRVASLNTYNRGAIRPPVVWRSCHDWLF